MKTKSNNIRNRMKTKSNKLENRIMLEILCINQLRIGNSKTSKKNIGIFSENRLASWLLQIIKAIRNYVQIYCKTRLLQTTAIYR